MASRIPLTIDTEQTIRLAIQLRAARNGASSSDVVNDILRQALSAEIAEVSGMAPLASLIQNLHECCHSRPTNGSHRPVSFSRKLTE